MKTSAGRQLSDRSLALHGGTRSQGRGAWGVSVAALTPQLAERFVLAGIFPVAYLLALAMAVTMAIATPGQIVHQEAQEFALRSSEAPLSLHRPPRRQHRQRVRSLMPVRRVPRSHYRVRRMFSTWHRALPAVSRSGERPPTPVPSSEAVLVIRIWTVATPDNMQTAINSCRGPVEINWRSDASRWRVHPDEITEHDYCGGSVFRSLRRGQRVHVIGGDLSGRYVVNGKRRFASPGSSADALNSVGEIVLQTCVPGGVVLIGLDRVD